MNDPKNTDATNEVLLSRSDISLTSSAKDDDDVFKPGSPSKNKVVDCGHSKGCSAGSGSTCLDGYEGTLCAVCSPGYGRGLGYCSPCESRVRSVVLLVFSVGCFVILISVAVVRSLKTPTAARTRSAAFASHAFVMIKVFSNHFSLLSPLVISATFAQLHSTASGGTRTLSHFGDLSLSQTNFVTCLFREFNAIVQLICVVCAVPALIVIELIVSKATGVAGSISQVAACVVQLLYMTLVSSSAALLQYDEIVFYDETAYVTESSPQALITLSPLLSDRSIDRETNGMGFVLGWLVLLIVGIGAPLFFVAGFNAQLRSQSRGVLLNRFRFLTSNFRPECWYWEAVVATRKTLGVLCVSALYKYPLTQLQMYGLVLTVYLVANDKVRPALRDVMHTAERLSCGSALVLINTLLLGVTPGMTPLILSTPAVSAVIISTQVIAAIGIMFALWRDVEAQLSTNPTRRQNRRKSGSQSVNSSDVDLESTFLGEPPTTTTTTSEEEEESFHDTSSIVSEDRGERVYREIKQSE